MELHSQTKANLCGLRISPCFVYTRSDTVLWNNRWVVAFVACDGEEVLSSEVDAKALKQVTVLRSEGVAEGYVVELEVALSFTSLLSRYATRITFPRPLDPLRPMSYLLLLKMSKPKAPRKRKLRSKFL